MLVYNSSDIIKRAREIADLEDSSFISWKEEFALLNEAYTSFYQKVIDKDEGYFVKNLILQNGKNVLPDDFYMVKYVGVINGNSNSPILRRAKTAPFSDMTYDIQNGCIYINGTTSSLGNIVLSYYTMPPTLTYPNETYTLPIEYTDRIVGCYKNNFLIGEREEGIVKVYSPYENISKEVEIGILLDGGELFRNGFVIWQKRDPNATVSACAEEASFFKDNVDTSWVYVKNNDLYLCSGGITRYNVFDVDNNIIKEIKTPISLDTTVGIIYEIGEDNLLFFDTNNGKLFTNDKVIEEKDVKHVRVSKDNTRIWYVKGDDIKEMDADLNEVYSTHHAETVIGINDVANENGYGITVADRFYETYKIISPLKDTVLNFSNGFFFPVIAYNLARSFKIKQGADFSAIEIKYNEALQQFYDSLSMDANNCVRIANVY